MTRKALALILSCIALLSLSCCLSANAQIRQRIIINGNGEVSPSTAPIQRVGNTYTLTADIYSYLVVEANNIVIDGANHTLQGPGENVNYAAVNLTSVNVTLENMRITNWNVGVLAAWNNNTITNNEFANNSQGIAIYSDDNVVRQNIILSCPTGVFIDGGFMAQGDNNLVTQNKIMNSYTAFDLYNNNGVIIRANDVENNDVILDLGTHTANTTLYLNNFENNQEVLDIPGLILGSVNSIVPVSPAGQWDNGTVGNYWSDYTTKYPNATEIDHTGIASSPYEIECATTYSETESGTEISGVAVLGTATDNHPLLAQVSTSVSIGPMQTASSSVPEYSVWMFFVVLLTASAFFVATLLRMKHQR